MKSGAAAGAGASLLKADSSVFFASAAWTSKEAGALAMSGMMLCALNVFVSTPIVRPFVLFCFVELILAG